MAVTKGAGTICLQDDPKSSQQRQRYEAARQQAEHQRVVLQKQVWLKQSLARRRVEAARQQQQLLLRSRAHAFHAKVDAIRLASRPAVHALWVLPVTSAKRERHN